MNGIEILKAARAIISAPEHWCQGTRDNGRGGHCALGAVDAAIGYRFSDSEAVIQKLAAAIRAIGFTNDAASLSSTYRSDAWLVANYNNTHTHAEVLAVFDRAIGVKKTDIGAFTRILDEVHKQERVEA